MEFTVAYLEETMTVSMSMPQWPHAAFEMCISRELRTMSTLLHLWEVVQIFQRESIFCSKISSKGSLFIEKLVPGGTNFGGSIFTMTDRSRVVRLPSVHTHPAW